MKITYQFTAQDIKDLKSGHYWGIHQTFGSLFFLRYGWLILSITGIVVASLITGDLFTSTVYLGTYTAILYTILREYHNSVWSEYCLPEKHTFFLQPWTLTVSEDGMTFDSDHASMRYSWKTIIEVNETTDFLYFWEDKVNFVPVPKRAFASPIQMIEFKQIVEKFRQNTPSPK
jgi:hypothetical protein